jgi:hypothetical protein
MALGYLECEGVHCMKLGFGHGSTVSPCEQREFQVP